MSLVEPEGLPRVVYVAGYGRSGSTLLDMILGLRDDSVGLGEVSRLFESLCTDAPCSCGLPVITCPFWSPVLQRVASVAPEVSYPEAARVTRLVEGRLMGRAPLRGEIAVYATVWRAVFAAIGEIAAVRYVVDSSKSTRRTAGRVAALSRHCGAAPVVIHLVRDPRAVSWSAMRGSNERLRAGEVVRPPGGTFRTLASWLLANVRAEAVGRTFPSIRIRYEDLVRQPARELERIGTVLQVDMTNLALQVVEGVPIHANHGIAGNRLRSGTVKALREDTEWRQALPRTARSLAALTWPLARRYEYAVLGGRGGTNGAPELDR